MEIDREKDWEVEEVLDAKIRYWKLQYLIKWTCYDIHDWQDAKDVNGLQDIDIFHQRYPNKLGPRPDDEDEVHDW